MIWLYSFISSIKQNVSCPSLPLDLWANKSKWPSPAQPRFESCFLNNIKNCHSGNLTSHPKIINLIFFFPVEINFNLAQNLRSAVILTSPEIWWWDTGPAASPEVWRLVDHGAQPDDCIYFREFIAFYQPLIADTHSRSPRLLQCVCVVCYYCCPYVFQLSWNFQAISIKVLNLSRFM